MTRAFENRVSNAKVKPMIVAGMRNWIKIFKEQRNLNSTCDSESKKAVIKDISQSSDDSLIEAVIMRNRAVASTSSLGEGYVTLTGTLHELKKHFFIHIKILQYYKLHSTTRF